MSEPCCICGEKECDHVGRHKDKEKEVADAVKQSPFANLLDGMLPDSRKTCSCRICRRNR